MTERIALLTIITLLWLFLFVFQNYMSTFWALIFLMTFMLLYIVYMQIAFKHQKRKLRKNPPTVNTNYQPFVSIMIPAHNEQFVIEKTVENILALNYEKYEIIIIDDRSEDDTAQVLRQLEKSNEKIKILIRDKSGFPGKSAVLNEAMAIAKGEALLIFDADARIEPNFLVELLPFLEPQEVGAVQARKCLSNRNFNFLTKCQDNEYALDTHFQIGRDAVKGAVELRGNGELIKREALVDIEGWNNHTITDDLDMSTRLHIKGWDVRFCPNTCVFEEGVIEFLPLLRQRRRWIEGSIRRYLEHFKDVLFSKDMSIRVSLDMTAYISEFILPFWLMSEIFFQAFKYVRSQDENTLLSSLVVTGAVGLFFIFGLFYSTRKYNGLSFFESLKQSFETCIYFFVLWFPIVVYIIPKIIFCKKTMDWGKTAHGVAEQLEITSA